MTPIIFIDLETTGLSAAIHAPLAIAAVVLSGDYHNSSFHRKMRPFKTAVVDERALQVNGYNKDEIWSWDDPLEICEEFQEWLDYVNPNNLVQAGGWNYKFDENFLREWITRHCDDPAYYGNTFATQHVEVMNEVKCVYCDWKARFANMKLATQYEAHFNKPLKDAHTEMADAMATRDIFLHCDKLKEEPKYTPYHL